MFRDRLSRLSLYGALVGVLLAGAAGCKSDKQWPYSPCLGPEGPACFPCQLWGGYHPTCWDRWPDCAPKCPPVAQPQLPPTPPTPPTPFTPEPTPAAKQPAAVNSIPKPAVKPEVAPQPIPATLPAQLGQPPLPPIDIPAGKMPAAKAPAGIEGAKPVATPPLPKLDEPPALPQSINGIPVPGK